MKSRKPYPAGVLKTLGFGVIQSIMEQIKQMWACPGPDWLWGDSQGRLGSAGTKSVTVSSHYHFKANPRTVLWVPL